MKSLAARKVIDLAGHQYALSDSPTVLPSLAKLVSATSANQKVLKTMSLLLLYYEVKHWITFTRKREAERFFREEYRYIALISERRGTDSGVRGKKSSPSLHSFFPP